MISCTLTDKQLELPTPKLVHNIVDGRPQAYTDSDVKRSKVIVRVRIGLETWVCTSIQLHLFLVLKVFTVDIILF